MDRGCNSRLASARLSIGKDGAIISRHDLFQDGPYHILINHSLISFRSKGLIEIVRLFPWHLGYQRGLHREGRDGGRLGRDEDLAAAGTGGGEDGRVGGADLGGCAATAR